jgi:hypothetical protein
VKLVAVRHLMGQQARQIPRIVAKGELISRQVELLIQDYFIEQSARESGPQNGLDEARIPRPIIEAYL